MDRKKKDKSPAGKLRKAKSRLYEKFIGFLKINIIIIIIDLFLLNSGFTIPMFVLLGTSIGLVSSFFNYISLKGKLDIDKEDDEDIEKEIKKMKEKVTYDFYDNISRELDATKQKISGIIEKCGKNVKNHKVRIMQDIDSISNSIKILIQKGRNIRAILCENDMNRLDQKKQELLDKVVQTENEMLKKDIMNHIDVLDHQREKYNKLAEAEEMIKVKIESTKSSLSTLILDLSRIDINPDSFLESELDAAINNIELKTVELNTLSDILDKQEI